MKNAWNWIVEEGGDAFILLIALLFALMMIMGVVALGKEVYCFFLAGCGG